jgi:acetyl esterase
MIDPEIQPFLSDWAKAWARLPAGASAADRRAHFEVIAREMRQPTPDGVTTEEQHIPVPGARPVRVRLFRPPGAAPRPALIYMHGGAWMQGSPETHWDITAGLAAAASRVVISVDYALAPEHPFPAAVNDCRAVVEWTFAESARLGILREAIAIGGDSAGANLAAAQTLTFRDTPIRLQGQLLVYPACDFDMSRPSYRENADGPIVTTASMPTVNAMYCPQLADLTNPLAAPLLAADHAGLPPAFVAVAEHDPLRDSGLAYADALRAAGVPVTLDRGESLIHGYLRAMAYCGRSRRAFERMGAWLRAGCSAPAGVTG